MKKLLSTSYSDASFNIAMMLVRVVSGILIVSHGYSKLVQFAELKSSFMNFLGMGRTLSLILIIFAEFFCGIFLTLGLFTRLAAIPLVIAMAVVIFKVNHGQLFGNNEKPVLFFIAFFACMLLGPGRVSVDAAMGK